MAEQTTTRAAHASRTRAVREVARLRAQRAARISREAAAGQRRMILAALFLLATLVTGIVGVATTFAVAWTGLPAALLLGTLAWSRWAAIHSAHMSQAENDLLMELREEARAPLPMQTSVVGTGSHGTASAVAEEVASLVEVATAPTQESDASADRSAASAVLQDDVAEMTAADDAAVSTPAQREGRLTWSVTPIPAPTYVRRGRVRGRNIKIDTDLRGIPQVQEISVPARPVAAQPLPSAALSTSDAVAYESVALDLDAVLESRRAQ